ncbi:MAG: hypothetical protein Q7N95_11675 [Alphaproteobacteria bacterium]|nr:hypothetical protein [Alphaproteobacteria bacterium]
MPQAVGSLVANLAIAFGAGAGTALTLAHFAATWGVFAGSLALNEQQRVVRPAKATP